MSDKSLYYLQMAKGSLAEFLANTILLYFGCMGCVDNAPFFVPTHFTICLMFGLVIMIVVNAFGFISGGHITPCVTIAAVVYKLVDYPTAIAYAIAQFLGSLTGYALLRLTIIDEYLKHPDIFCLILPNLDIGRALFSDFMVAFAFIATICAIFDFKNANHHDSVALRVGLLIATLAFLGGPFGGAGSLHPSRVLAPAIYNLHFDNHWIYWVAGPLGALAASLVFKLLFVTETKSNSLTYVDERKDHEIEAN